MPVRAGTFRCGLLEVNNLVCLYNNDYYISLISGAS